MAQLQSGPMRLAEILEDAPPEASKARTVLTARLSELVTWPATRIPTHERHLAADVLMALLTTASVEVRQRLAERLSGLEDPPRALLRYLAVDEIAVARHLLEEGVGFDDSDLMTVIRGGYNAHCRIIAGRKNLSELVADFLIQMGDPEVTETVLLNKRARISQTGIDHAVSASQRNPRLIVPLLQRAELKPSQALVMFWWAEFDERVNILRRYAAERRTLAGELGAAFREAAVESWSDPEVRKALQVIERRQRNRAAVAKSPYGSLEEAIEAGHAGLNRQIATEMGYLAGVKPVTIMRILTDKSGESIGVFAKATGLKREYLGKLWRALRRPIGEPGASDTPFGRTNYVYEILATAKAQTALRYWNWSFSADSQEINTNSIDDAEDALLLTPARRNAALLFGRFSQEG